MTRKPRKRVAKGPEAVRRDAHRRKGRKDKAARKAKSAPTVDKSTQAHAGTDKARRSSQPFSRRKLWAFRVVSIIVVPLVILSLLELGLRIGGYGYPPGATIEYESGGKTWIADNGKFAWRFFPKRLAREFEPFAFARQKPAKTYRVFVLGSSAAQGIPDAAFGFGRMLEVMLEAEYEGVDFEVVTAAMSAINSHVVRVIAADLARFEPDMFVVYLGNNEVIGPYGLVSLFKPVGQSLALIRASIAAKQLKISQLAGSLGDGELSEWRGMAMFTERQVRSSDKRLAGVYSHYRQNLEDIRDIALGADAKVVLCTVASNLRDNPPFASLHRQGLTEEQLSSWEQLYEAGVQFEAEGEYEKACGKYVEAGDIDGEFADLQFRLGRCLWQQGQFEKAEERFVLAREYDTMRFRADLRMNEMVREVAGKGGDNVALVDCMQALSNESPHGVTGQELFWEHVHLNFKGNYLLGRVIFEQVRQMLPEWVTKTARGGQAASEQYCADALAYTRWDKRESMDETLNGFLANPPFTGQMCHDETTRRWADRLAELDTEMADGGLEEAAGRYEAAIEKNWNDWVLHYKYGKLLAEDIKDFKRAEAEFRAVIALIGHSYIGYESLGTVLRMDGRLNAAAENYEKAVEIKPTSSEGHYYLGWVYQKLMDMKSAEKHYRRVLELRPSYMPAYNNLGEVLFGQDRVDDAIEICRRGLEIDPDYAVLRSNLGVLLNEKGDREQALAELHRALELDPNSPGIRNVLKAILREQQGDSQ